MACLCLCHVCVRFGPTFRVLCTGVAVAASACTSTRVYVRVNKMSAPVQSPTDQKLSILLNKPDVNMKDLLEALVLLAQSMKRMDESMKRMEDKLDGIAHTLSPMSNPLIDNTPVVTQGAFLTNERNGVFTWFQYPGLPPAAIGAAHTALRYATVHVEPRPPDGSHLLFIALPHAVLTQSVVTVRFIDVAQMSNPLPPELDVCLVEVASHPQGTLPYIPQFKQFPFPAAGQPLTSTTSGVVGKACGAYVSSRGGMVEVSGQPNALGRLHFLLETGEPGDSGTLLHIKMDGGEHTPHAIFTGLSSATTARQARGQGCIIPPFGMFQTALNVVNMANYGLRRVVLASRSGMRDFQPSVHGNVVSLKDNSGQELTGVFVRAPRLITYTGDADIALMSSYGLPPSSQSSAHQDGFSPFF